MTSTSGETRGHFRSSYSTSTVETREQFERLKSLGVNFAQGYLMGRPVPIDELERQPQVYRSRLDAA
jgi:EAL domain-containing protein (putative c-di-GMP-specific phosphodiesterase class I)